MNGIRVPVANKKNPGSKAGGPNQKPLTIKPYSMKNSYSISVIIT